MVPFLTSSSLRNRLLSQYTTSASWTNMGKDRHTRSVLISVLPTDHKIIYDLWIIQCSAYLAVSKRKVRWSWSVRWSVCGTKTTDFDLRTVSREFLTEFIHMYLEYPCLWKVNSKKYSDRVKKNLAYEHLARKLKEIDPDANKEKVVKKINSLRSCFRKELKKVNDSKTSGAWGRRNIHTELVEFPRTLISYRPGSSEEGHQ